MLHSGGARLSQRTPELEAKSPKPRSLHVEPLMLGQGVWRLIDLGLLE